MLFNSIDFAVFLPIVFFLYWFITNKNLKLQNYLIVCASYLFYGWWDWRFLSLIFFSTILDFVIGLNVSKQKNPTRRKLLLWTSIIVNLGILGFFKYYNFFIEQFVTAFSFFGREINANSLDIILPVGISFYTFQTLSYTIDVYKNKLKPAHSFIEFAAFVAFFPQLVAGPIERATHLLPQFYKARKFTFENGFAGMKLIIYGLFKKIVIADSLAPAVNDIFAHYNEYSAGTLIVGAICFSFQIYGDFSGYSDIAIGTSKFFGFDLMTNFRFPYFSRSISEFWRKWHISLSTWFRDYLYIPLGGSRGGKWIGIRNVLIIFLVSGFWHGASWTFITWGAIHACLFVPSFIIGTNRKYTDDVKLERNLLDVAKVGVQIATTFILVTLAWVFFRAENMSHAFDYLSMIFTDFNFTDEILYKKLIISYILPFVIIDFLVMSQIKLPRKLLWLIILVGIEIICIHALESSSQEFIYFDF